MAATTGKLNVLDDVGLDTLLEALFSKFKETYVSQSNFDSRVEEIIGSMESTGNGLGFVSFDLRESDGHLIMTYTGDEAPNLKINDQGHLILTIA